MQDNKYENYLPDVHLHIANKKIVFLQPKTCNAA